MKLRIAPFLLVLGIVFFDCNYHLNSHSSNVVEGNRKSLSALSTDTISYLIYAHSDKRDSLFDEIYIQIQDNELRLFDTIRSETIRKEIHDSILFSGEISDRKVNHLKLKTIDVSESEGKKCYTLTYALKSNNVPYKYRYDIHYTNLNKTSSNFKAL
jgi:hypothetical protein